MSTDTDPTWILAIWIVLGTFTLACLAFLAIDAIRAWSAWIDRQADEAHIAEAIRLTEADIDADRAWDELMFMASVRADLDSLNGDIA